MWLKVPHMVVGGDGMYSTDSKGNPLGWNDGYEKYAGHPRTAGTHAKVLRLGREHDVPLMFSLAQLSYWHAKHLGDAGIERMRDRGRMQEGMVADIVIFDPETVSDKAGYRQGTSGLPSTGIPYVLVNGKVVVNDSKVQKVMAGEPIQFPVEEKGRFVPATKEMWLKTITIDSGGVAPKEKSSQNQPAPSGQSSLRPGSVKRPSDRFWWGDHHQGAGFGGHCCEFHMLQSRFAAMEKWRRSTPQE
jgi:hypothetical protein